jgi:uncharacterized membrane protein
MNDHLDSPFGSDRFGQSAERFARFFGTPRFIIGQTLIVMIWIGLNVIAINARWDPYPFILLNLAFSTQAAYAAPLILLAQTRQADRDTAATEDIARIAETQRRHVEDETGSLRALLNANTRLTETIARLTADVHAATCNTPTIIFNPRTASTLE